MDVAVHHAIERLLDAFTRDFAARVPESGPFPEHEWEVPLPPPYGPSRRVVLRATAVDDPRRCSVEIRVATPEGGWDGRWLGASPVVGARAGMREEIRSPWTRRKIERFLARVTSDLEAARDAEQPLHLPLVAIDRKGVPYAALDPREVHVERWGPGDLHCATWLLLLREGDAWRDVGAAGGHAETERFYLHDRVLATLAAFDGRSRGGFRFRLWEGSVPPRDDRVNGDEVDRQEPAVARLRKICRAVIDATPNQEEKLIGAIKRMARGDEPPGPPSGPLARVLRGLGSLFRRG